MDKLNGWGTFFLKEGVRVPTFHYGVATWWHLGWPPAIRVDLDRGSRPIRRDQLITGRTLVACNVGGPAPAHHVLPVRQAWPPGVPSPRAVWSAMRAVAGGRSTDCPPDNRVTYWFDNAAPSNNDVKINRSLRHADALLVAAMDTHRDCIVGVPLCQWWANPKSASQINLN